MKDVRGDPLQYWCTKQQQYPVLAEMVRKYQSPPPGSASAERLFSAAKLVLGQTRLAMRPENMEQNLFLKYGLRALTTLPDVHVPEGFVAPNSATMPPVTTDRELVNEIAIDIVISSDNDSDMDQIE